MLKFISQNFSICITIVLALAAFVSPVIVARINNRHNTKMHELELKHEYHLKKLEYQQKMYSKRLEVYYADKKSAFDAFAKTAAAYPVSSQPYATLVDLQSAAGCALLVCSASTQNSLSNFIHDANELDRAEDLSPEELNRYFIQLHILCGELNEELRSTRPQPDNEQ